jgi:hypothetical protein
MWPEVQDLVRNRSMSSRSILAILFACISALVCCSAQAQPREVVAVRGEAIETVTDPTAVADWLRRLVGSYNLDGAIGDAGIKGKADCTAIGTGPGVQCIFNAIWQEKWDTLTGRPIILDPLDPSMFLFGMDPSKATLNMLMVIDKGIASGGTGTIKGTASGEYGTIIKGLGATSGHTGTIEGITASFKTCTQEGYCEPSIRIEAKAEASILYMWVVGAALTLRRVREESDTVVPGS